MDSTKKFVYFFADGKAEGHAGMKDLLGGKGAGLAEMTNIGVPVPPGFTITTEVCRLFYESEGHINADIERQILDSMARLESITGKGFGDPTRPLLVSVRSGAKFSMPGMMDTILNLGMNDEVAAGLSTLSGDSRFVADTYRRFLQMFGEIALGIARERFNQTLKRLKDARGITDDLDLTVSDLEHLIEEYKSIIKEMWGRPFPQDPYEQLRIAIEAVFKSWNNPRAIYYRKMNGIPDDLGTAVNIVMMVYGNMGEESGTGVGFTRDPATGAPVLYGEFLPNAQGEDVVAGIRTPLKIEELQNRWPTVYDQLKNLAKTLETHYRDMQDFEFTVEKGRLYFLQTRAGKRTAQAAVRIAVDMVNEGLISKEEAVLRITPEHIERLLHPIIDPSALSKAIILAKGLPASPGAASGKIVFTADDAVQWADRGENVILVREETVPDDIHGMDRAVGILTSRGGMTSHAAVVARGMGKTCIVGCETLHIDFAKKSLSTGEVTLHEGDWITIDGSNGTVYKDALPTLTPEPSGPFQTLMEWVDEYRRLKVRANADTPKDATKAFQFGAQGIGLCRTEHMFFADDRLPIMQRMILSENESQRRAALNELLQFQIQDFIGIFRAMRGYPVTIRLIDPPLHEFLPRREELIQEIANLKFELTRVNHPSEIDALLQKLTERQTLLTRVKQLHEMNPMLGHRGVRLVISYPEIVEMQTRAIIEAAIQVDREFQSGNADPHLNGIRVRPEIMIPLVSMVQEIKFVRDIILKTAQDIMESYNHRIIFLVGTMIEVPRACVTADQIAEYAEFFSFGTNDLTQMTFGFSRDDIPKFLPTYLDKKIITNDPFISIDRDGVGELMHIAVRKGKSTRGNLKLGICGEHGGDPASVQFCHEIGLDYVSCSPFRVPVARLAAAHAALKERVEVGAVDV